LFSKIDRAISNPCHPYVLAMQSGQDGNGDDYASWLDRSI
jgi:hypothetical protein